MNQQDLSDLLGRDVTGDDGALAAIDSACQVVRAVVEEDFAPVTSDEALLDGTGTDVLFLPHANAYSAGTVIVDGTAIGDYALADRGRLIRMPSNPGSDCWPSDWWPGWPYLGSPGYPYFQPIWPLGRQNIAVIYDRGQPDVPSPVRMIALQLAARIIVQGVAVAETVGPTAIRYQGPPMDLTPGEKAILRRYRPSR